VATLGLPDSPGVPAALASLTLTAPFNDAEAVADLFKKHGDRIAAVIVEPYVGNAGFIAPEPGFHIALRSLCDRHGALLIFDEVMTGFRVAAGGAQERLRIRPDLTALGKIVGGGFPVGVYGGRADLMKRVAPEGPVYQAGTLSGNPVAMAAGLATLRETSRPRFYDELEKLTARLTAGSRPAPHATVCRSRSSRGSMWGAYFTAGPVRNYADARKADTALFLALAQGRIGSWRLPRAVGVRGGLCLERAHEADIDFTLQELDAALGEAAR